MKTSIRQNAFIGAQSPEKYPRIRFACDCDVHYNVPRSWAGRLVRCKQCGMTLRVPYRDEFHLCPNSVV